MPQMTHTSLMIHLFLMLQLSLTLHSYLTFCVVVAHVQDSLQREPIAIKDNFSFLDIKNRLAAIVSALVDHTLMFTVATTTTCPTGAVLLHSALATQSAPRSDAFMAALHMCHTPGGALMFAGEMENGHSGGRHTVS